MSQCLVRGSVNIDEFFFLPHIVNPGETITSTKLTRRAGGKGANQACAVARSGGKVELVGSIGGDGLWVRDLLSSYGVGVEGLEVDEQGVTGRAIIQLANDGENSIILNPGTNYNALALPETLPHAPTHLLLQNEIPLEHTLHYLSLTKKSSPRVQAVFNPSPMPSKEVIETFPWADLAWLCVNEGELDVLLASLPPSDSRSVTSFPSVTYVGPTFPKSDLLPTLQSSLLRLATHPSFISTASSSPSLVLTLGPAGSLTLLRPAGEAPSSLPLIYTPAAQLQGTMRDTTGAGDCFAGFLVGGLMRLAKKEGEQSVKETQAVLKVATQAAGLCVERHGAQEAVPTYEEVLARLAETEKAAASA